MDLKNKYFGKTKEEAAKKKIDIKKENKQIFDAVKQFERNEIATVQGKAKFITRIAVVLLISNIALAAAIAFLSPLKTAVPFVIRVDNNTSYTDIAPQLSGAKQTYQEAETKYNLAKFVINYESYDWQTIQEMLDTVNVMSNNKVFSQYNTAIRADNSPLNV
ncbi:conjugal transfer protein TraG, partial [Escherichia coli]|nr:conjugal transfer protein TraG [Escherichia coli]EHY3364764.1 conjugal transfer protein TraG [Escherichia coli]